MMSRALHDEEKST